MHHDISDTSIHTFWIVNVHTSDDQASTPSGLDLHHDLLGRKEIRVPPEHKGDQSYYLLSTKEIRVITS